MHGYFHKRIFLVVTSYLLPLTRRRLFSSRFVSSCPFPLRHPKQLNSTFHNDFKIISRSLTFKYPPSHAHPLCSCSYNFHKEFTKNSTYTSYNSRSSHRRVRSRSQSWSGCNHLCCCASPLACRNLLQRLQMRNRTVSSNTNPDDQDVFNLFCE